MHDLDALIEEARALSAALPFGDSQAKKLMFANGQQGPAQELRHHALQLRTKLTDLKKAQFQRQRTLIDIAELEQQLTHCRNEFDRQRIAIDLEEKRFDLAEGEKYIADALLEVQIARVRIAELPPIADRADYERQEALYWVNKLLADLQDQQAARGWLDVGTVSALRDIGLMLERRGDQLTFLPDAPRLARLGLALTDIPLLKEAAWPAPLNP